MRGCHSDAHLSIIGFTQDLAYPSVVIHISAPKFSNSVRQFRSSLWKDIFNCLTVRSFFFLSRIKSRHSEESSTFSIDSFNFNAILESIASRSSYFNLTIICFLYTRSCPSGIINMSDSCPLSIALRLATPLILCSLINSSGIFLLKREIPTFTRAIDLIKKRSGFRAGESPPHPDRGEYPVGARPSSCPETTPTTQFGRRQRQVAERTLVQPREAAAANALQEASGSGWPPA